jgi:hypothetical protein
VNKKTPRALLQTLGWLAMPVRAGDIEELDAIIGRVPEGATWEVRRPDNSGVVLAVGPEGMEHRLEPEQVGRWLMEGRFVPERSEL